VAVPGDLDVEKVRVKNGDNVLGSVARSPNKPSVQVESPNGGGSLTGGSINVEWSASDSDGDELFFDVQYSPDGGGTWTPVNINVTGRSANVDLENLAGSSQGIIRVEASDGFNTSKDESDGTFTVPNNSPDASIITPTEGKSIGSSAPLQLKGSAFDREDGPLSGSNLKWKSSKDGELGSGKTLTLPASDLSEGEHTITLEAVDSDGVSTEVSVTIEIVEATAETDPGAPTCSELNLSEITFQISDFDASQEGEDTSEFVELTNTGTDPIALGGCSMVFFDGADSKSYMAADLGGTADAGGTFTLGNPTVEGVDQVFSEGTFQDGPDAMALYKAPASDFPDDTPVTTNLESRLSAVVYVSDDNIFDCYNASVPGCNSKSATTAGDPPLLRLEELANSMEKDTPEEFALNQNSPNPFSGRTTIRYDLPEEATVEIVVYDLLGRRVRSLELGRKQAGEHEATLSARDLSTGTYFLKLKAGDQVDTQSIQIVR